MGVELSRVEQRIDGDLVTVDLWDTAGQERFKSLNKVYFRGAHGVILVYDITNKHSFEQLKSWYKVAKDNGCDPVKCVYLLIGNKSDLADVRAVDPTEGVNFARSINANFFEASALSSDNVENAINDLVEEIHKMNKSRHSRQDPQSQSIQLKDGSEIKPRAACCAR